MHYRDQSKQLSYFFLLHTMSRLRKFEHQVLQHMLDDSDNDIIGDEDGVSFYPLDLTEQEDLIRRLELRNSSKNGTYLKILTFAYLIVCGMFILLATRIRRDNELMRSYRRIFLFSAQSISCSVITLRYEFFNNYFTRRRINFFLTSKRLNILNFTLLIFLLWIINSQDGPMAITLLCYVPHLLFVTTIFVKRSMSSIESDLGLLRTLHYKFKNV